MIDLDALEALLKTPYNGGNLCYATGGERKLLDVLPDLIAEVRRLRAENERLRAFWQIANAYLMRGGDAADYLPLDVLAAWQDVKYPNDTH